VVYEITAAGYCVATIPNIIDNISSEATIAALQLTVTIRTEECVDNYEI